MSCTEGLIPHGLSSDPTRLLIHGQAVSQQTCAGIKETPDRNSERRERETDWSSSPHPSRRLTSSHMSCSLVVVVMAASPLCRATRSMSEQAPVSIQHEQASDTRGPQSRISSSYAPSCRGGIGVLVGGQLRTGTSLVFTAACTGWTGHGIISPSKGFSAPLELSKSSSSH